MGSATLSQLAFLGGKPPELIMGKTKKKKNLPRCYKHTLSQLVFPKESDPNFSWEKNKKKEVVSSSVLQAHSVAAGFPWGKRPEFLMGKKTKQEEVSSSVLQAHSVAAGFPLGKRPEFIMGKNQKKKKLFRYYKHTVSQLAFLGESDPNLSWNNPPKKEESSSVLQAHSVAAGFPWGMRPEFLMGKNKTIRSIFLGITSTLCCSWLSLGKPPEFLMGKTQRRRIFLGITSSLCRKESDPNFSCEKNKKRRSIFLGITSALCRSWLSLGKPPEFLMGKTQRRRNFLGITSTLCRS